MHRIALAALIGFPVLALPAVVSAKTIDVRPGESIQAAVDRARPGDRVRVGPGTYRERGRRCPARRRDRCAVVVAKNRIQLVANPGRRRPVVLQGRRGQAVGIAVGRTSAASCLKRASKRVRGPLVKGFTVRGFRDGVSLSCVERFRVTRLRALDGRAHGIFASLALSGRIDHSLARGARRVGVHVSQSSRVRIDHTQASRNATALEIDNSSGVRADHNLASGNSAGIVVVALPRLGVKDSSRNVVEHNRVEANNRRRSCSSRREIACRVPAGAGILLLGADHTRVATNRVRANRSFGIAVASYCTGLGLTASTCSTLDTEPNPDHNLVSANTATGNGHAEQPWVPALFPVDIDWDQSGTGNCWVGNVADRSFSSRLPNCRPAEGAPAPILAGVSEQDLSMFSDPLFADLHIRRARMIVPWNVLTSSLESNYVGDWLQSARSAGVEPFVHFTTATGSRCPNHPCHLPSVAEYAEAFKAFRERWPFVRVFGTWNEANHPSQPTFQHPARAAEYYNAMRANCPGCQVVAADVIDDSNMVPWVFTFREHADQVDIWGLHNYRDVNQRPGQLSGGTRQLLSVTNGDVWLTEAGGIVEFVMQGGQTVFAYDEARADQALKRMFELAVSNRHRIARVYLFNWRAREGRWDSALLRDDGSPRPSYFTARETLRGPSFRPD